MSLRKRGDREGFEGFIDLDQMRKSLLGDPSDSDPGYEVTNLIHKISKKLHTTSDCNCDEYFCPIFKTGQICYYLAITQKGISLWIVRKPVDSVLVLTSSVTEQ